MKAFLYIAGVMALVAVLPLDGQYYSVLRLVLAAAGIAMTIRAINAKATGWAITGVIIFALWFPAFGVYLDKGLWAVLDLAVAAIFFVFASSRFARANGA